MLAGLGEGDPLATARLICLKAEAASLIQLSNFDAE